MYFKGTVWKSKVWRFIFCGVALGLNNEPRTSFTFILILRQKVTIFKNVVNFGGKTLKNNLLKFYSALSLTPQDSEDDSMSMASRNLTLRC